MADSPAKQAGISGRLDPDWRKSRIAARIILRKRAGHLYSRDIRLAKKFHDDPGVTDRLIDQALASFSAPRRNRP